MKRKLSKLSVVLSAAIALSSVGCTKTEPTKPEEPATRQENLPVNEIGAVEKKEITYKVSEKSDENSINDEEMKKLSDSSFVILNECIKYDGEKNILVSPFSIQSAMGMVMNGAGGTSRAQIETSLYGGLKTEDVNKAMRLLSQRMESDQDVSWNVANSIWLNTKDTNVELKDSFLNTVGTYYDSELYKLTFDNEAKDMINAWVNKETKEMIPSILNEAPQGRMHLINAVAFEGKWAQTYSSSDIIENVTFTNADGSTTNVNMLSSELSSYFTLDGGKGFKANYAGNQYSFVGILPPENVTANDYIKRLAEDSANFSEAFLNNNENATVYVQFPEFKTEYDNELSDELKEMGIVEAFTDYADFSELNTGTGQKIDKVFHKTFIEVTREGTKAAAVTDIQLTDAACIIEEEPVIIHLDRPFVYAIVDNVTGIPVFIGVQNQF